MEIYMKKNILYFIAVVLSLLITFVFFELMSWYHFGDIPTKVVLVRLIAFFLVVAGLLISIVAFINKKKIIKVKVIAKSTKKK